MFYTNCVLVVLGFSLCLFYNKVPLGDEDTDDNGPVSNDFEEDMARKMRETRERFEWILENRRDAPEVQRLLKILKKINMSEKEFCEVIPQIKYEVSDELYESMKHSDMLGKCNRDDMMEAVKNSDIFDGDKSKIKGMMALMRAQEGDLDESDRDWIEKVNYEE